MIKELEEKATILDAEIERTKNIIIETLGLDNIHKRLLELELLLTDNLYNICCTAKITHENTRKTIEEIIKTRKELYVYIQLMLSINKRASEQWKKIIDTIVKFGTVALSGLIFFIWLDGLSPTSAIISLLYEFIKAIIINPLVTWIINIISGSIIVSKTKEWLNKRKKRKNIEKIINKKESNVNI